MGGSGLPTLHSDDNVVLSTLVYSPLSIMFLCPKFGSVVKWCIIQFMHYEIMKRSTATQLSSYSKRQKVGAPMFGLVVTEVSEIKIDPSLAGKVHQRVRHVRRVKRHGVSRCKLDKRGCC